MQTTTADLRDYPALMRAWEESGASLRLDETFVGRTLSNPEQDWFISDVQSVNRALEILLGSFPAADLREHIRRLFDRRAELWEAGHSELAGFRFLHEARLLDCIGWPKGPSDTPAFDGRMIGAADPRATVAFDFKQANGSGQWMLVGDAQALVDEWTAAYGLEPAAVEHRFRGLPTQLNYGRRRRDFRAEFRERLFRQRILPATVEVRVDAVRVELTVVPQKTERPSGSMYGVQQVVDELKGQFQLHVEEKSVHGEPFLLFYVRLQGRGGSDIRMKPMKAALNDYDGELQGAPVAQPNWLGSILLDWVAQAAQPPCRGGHLRPEARWPVGTSPQTVAGLLSLDANT